MTKLQFYTRIFVASLPDKPNVYAKLNKFAVFDSETGNNGPSFQNITALYFKMLLEKLMLLIYIYIYYI